LSVKFGPNNSVAAEVVVSGILIFSEIKKTALNLYIYTNTHSKIQKKVTNPWNTLEDLLS